jgi:uncharacterized C2H2 Zn-finger protein
MLRCHTCNYECNKKSLLERHKQSIKHKNNILKNLKCDECNKVFASKQNLINHNKKQHRYKVSSDEDETINDKIKKLEKDVKSIKNNTDLFYKQIMHFCSKSYDKSKPIYDLDKIHFLKCDEITLEDDDEATNDKIVNKVIKYKKKDRLGQKIVTVIFKKYKIKSKYPTLWSCYNLDNVMIYLLKVKDNEGLEKWIIDKDNEILRTYINKFLHEEIKISLLTYCQNKSLEILNKLINKNNKINTAINDDTEEIEVILEIKKNISLCKKIISDIDDGTLLEYTLNEISKECISDETNKKYIDEIKSKLQNDELNSDIEFYD